MRILVGKTFGIGNACLAVPMIKAIASLGHVVDVLVGDGPDDFGSYEVFRELRRRGEEPVVNKIYRGCVPFAIDTHDVAIMAIPYDGRWRNGIDFFAHRVMDERKRPENIERLGFDMWKKHEVEYMMENARELGYVGDTPDGSFIDPGPSTTASETVYLGIGYKRDLGGFGESKHFGNYSFSGLIGAIRKLRPSVRFVSTGNQRDAVEIGFPITRGLGIHAVDRPNDAYRMEVTSLERSFVITSGCVAYIGNDTGMMHVAASLGLPTMGLFTYPDLIVKNPPFCARSRALFVTPRGPAVDEIARQFVDFVWE